MPKDLIDEINKSTIIAAVDKEIVDTANDVIDYLAFSNVPMECYVEDIDIKLCALRERVKKALDKL